MYVLLEAVYIFLCHYERELCLITAMPSCTSFISVYAQTQHISANIIIYIQITHFYIHFKQQNRLGQFKRHNANRSDLLDERKAAKIKVPQ